MELRKLKALYLGDGERLEQIQAHFEAGKYPEVLAVFAELKYPDLLNESQRQLIELARARVGG